MNQKERIEAAKPYFMNTYNRAEMIIERGEGVYLYDVEGNRYLDFLSGIAVNVLGYQHPDVSEAIQEANQSALHLSNLMWNQPNMDLAKHLVEHSSLDQVFFANSGAEANEGAIKLARKWGRETKGQEAIEIITMKQSFHGRTLATLTATGQEHFHHDFAPMVEGFKYVPFNDLDALKETVNDKTCAILFEVIQGEGGVIEIEQAFVDGIVDLAKEHNVLLIVDEIQTGNGRTGRLYAHEHYGLDPDIVTLAKGIANGVPMGAVLAKGEIAKHFQVGDHGTTFGGNPLASSAALATQKVVSHPDFLEHVSQMGDYLTKSLEKLKEKHATIQSIRGKGLMKGFVLDQEAAPIYRACLEKGLIANATASNVLRLLPPLIIEKEHIDEATSIIDEVLSTEAK